MKAVSPNYSVHPVMQQDGYRIIHESDIAVGQRVFLVNEPTRQNVDQIQTATIVSLQYSGICRWRKLSSVVLEFKDFGKLEIGVVDLINPQTTPTGGPRQAFYVKS